MVLRPARGSTASASGHQQQQQQHQQHQQQQEANVAPSQSGAAMRSSSEPGDGVPAFLAKLWKLVDESRTNHLICWGPGGNSFTIKNQIDFARKLLPLYYKHNNMASFVRQLNMYGFHKVVSVENGSLKSENEEIQFSHPCFMRGHPYMLQHIKRKIATSRTNNVNNTEEKALLKPELMSKVLLDVKHMKGRQESLDARFTVMKRENETLWREVALLRQKHIKQQQIVNNLIQFLMSLVQPLKTGVKRRYQLMINDAAHNNDDDIINRKSKFAKRDSENDMDEEENEFVIPDMVDCEVGPIIHEVGEHDSLNNSELADDSSPYDEALLKNASVLSSVSNQYELDEENIADADDNNIYMRMGDELDSQNLENVDNVLEIPELDSSIINKNQIINKGKCKKNFGKKTKKKIISYSPLTTNEAQASPTLPSNIFDSDETNSQDETALLIENPEDILLNVVNDAPIVDARSATPDMGLLNTINTGYYNPNINLNALISNSKGKSKVKKEMSKENLLNIKEEIGLDDDATNWDEMTVATIPNENTRPPYNRFNSVTSNLENSSSHHTSDKQLKILPASFFPNEDVDGHLMTMQNDIDNLRELLCGDNLSFDANALLGLFEHEEPLYGLSINPSDMTTLKNDRTSDSQLISYVPPMPNLGFEDIMAENDADSQQSVELPSSSVTDDSTLNTPQIQLSELKFPSN